jgi:phage-related protein
MMRKDKQLFWVGDSRANLKAFPEEVKDVIGFALRQAQQGGKHPLAKPLKGFRGAGVLEVVETMMATLIVLFTLCGLKQRFMFYMPSRRSLKRGHRHHRWILP